MVEIKIKCKQGSPEVKAVLPLFILLETEMVENNSLSLSVTPFRPHYEALRYKPLFKGVRHLDIYIVMGTFPFSPVCIWGKKMV